MTTPAQLTADQQAGVDAFISFLLTNAKTFVIAGGAGVGKTFLMGHLANKAMQLYQDLCALMDIEAIFDSVDFTATTNKAADVLGATLGAQVSTIQSFISLRVREDYKAGKTYLSKSTGWREMYKRIVFIDECSMIDEQLYSYIMETFKDSKIIFVGDPAQLAPVGEKISKVFLTSEPEHMVFLGQPVRNAGQPALMALCSQLRETVETGIFRPIHEVPGVIDYLNEDCMIQEIEDTFADLDPSSRVLCYTNDRVKGFNSAIREDVRKLPAQFTVGEVLVVGQTYSTGAKGISVNVETQVQVLSIKAGMTDDWIQEEHPDEDPIEYCEVGFKALTGDRIEFTARVATNPEQLSFWLRHFSKNKSWSSFFELKSRYIDVRDSAACTVYKAQGSTYESVYIDLGNIGGSFDPEQVARMLFVAASRATTRVCFSGRLPARYHDSKGVPLWTPYQLSTISSSALSHALTKSA